MRQILGRLCGLLGLVCAGLLASGEAALAQSIVDRVAFKVPGLIITWDRSGHPEQSRAAIARLDEAGCFDFASNTAVEVSILAAGADVALRAEKSGRSARPLEGGEERFFRHLSFAQRTALYPDTPRHQALTVCAYDAGERLDPEAASSVLVGLKVLD